MRISFILVHACACTALDLRVRPAVPLSLRSGLQAVANRATASPSAPAEIDACSMDGLVVPQRLYVQDGVTDAPAEPATLAVEQSAAESSRFTWQSLRGGVQLQRESAAKLLKRYGFAYILCSLSLSAISFSIFYALVSHGVDASALLQSVGISLSGKSERFGTLANVP